MAMMTGYVVVGLAAFGVAGLTLFSGFGLGTLLMPVFALFFPVEVAVGSTAVVHAANNVVRLGLVGRDAAWAIVWRFGVPAVLAAFAGAWVLGMLVLGDVLWEWRWGVLRGRVSVVKVVMGVLILLFAAVELWGGRAGREEDVSSKWLALGGVLSGFFGGLSGHQGALRAAFLGPLGLPPARFVGTQAVLACMVDATRLCVYGLGFVVFGRGAQQAVPWCVVGFACVCAFGGSVVGKRLLGKVTVRVVRWVTVGLLVMVGLGLSSGLV